MGCFGGESTNTTNPIQYDPLGRNAAGNNMAPTGGPEQRSAIFNQLNAVSPQANAAAQQAAGGMQQAAANPGFQQAAANANKTIQGGYLAGTPEFQSSLGNYANTSNKATLDYLSGIGKVGAGIRERAAAGAADQGANTASQMSRIGQGFSTANQQAQQAGKAAAGAQADQTVAQLENAGQQAAAGQRQATAGNVMGAQTQNYAQERGRQAAGADQLNSSLGAPLQYLSQVGNTLMAPSQQQAGIVSGLATGGPVGQPQTMMYRQPGVQDYLMPLIGAGAAGGM